MSLLEATVDSPDMPGSADTPVVPRVVTVSAVCIRDLVSPDILQCRRLPELSLMRLARPGRSLPEIPIISVDRVNEGMTSEITASDVGGAGGILTPIHI